MDTPRRYRQTRSLARTAGKIDRAHEPSQAKKDARRNALLKTLGDTVLRVPNGIVLQAPDLFVQKVLSFVLLIEAVG